MKHTPLPNDSGDCVECGSALRRYRQSWRHMTRTITPAEARFWRFVRKGEGCWEWTGARTSPTGHGRFAVKATKPIVKVVSHRFSWEIHYGQIPAGREVCHSCDNPICVRPDHLWIGTHQQNMQDAGNKNRMGAGKRWTHCRRGHLFEGNTYIHPDTGRRECLVCRRERERSRFRGHMAAMNPVGASATADS